MKKYLMLGIATAAISAVFTSCSKNDFEPMSEAQIQEAKRNKIEASYNQAFINTFGQPAANQTWGFGSKTTRAANVNGNQWHDGVNYDYEYDAKVTKDEMNKVFNYVNNKNNVVTVDQISFQEYWVSQIWNGEDDENATGVKAPKSISYRDQNGATKEIVGGAQMDKLEIKETADGGWIHCNNFNSADNNDWKEDGEGGRTLMTSSGTYSFRYTNSQSSYLSEKYIIVPGEKIDASLAGFYYVCFDFERGYDAKELAEERSYGTCKVWRSQATEQDPDAGYWQDDNWNLAGFYNNASSEELLTKLVEEKGAQVKDITFKGYLYGDKHCDGDDNYTDWIVRISPAKERYKGRIFAEDLNAKEGSDFDFNDVVFDWKITNNGANAQIHLLAAGGTMPLRIGGTIDNEDSGVEVHAKFGVNTNIMVNTATDGAPKIVVKPYQDFVISASEAGLTAFEADGSNIPIFVKKDAIWVELHATRGEPAAKFNCPTGTKWVDEYVDIKLAYPDFKDWVQNPAIEWWNNWVEKYVNLLLKDNKE